MPCQGFSQMLSGFLHHCQQRLLLDIQIMYTMHCQGTTGSGSNLLIVLLTGIILGKGKDRQEINFYKNSISWFEGKKSGSLGIG